MAAAISIERNCADGFGDFLLKVFFFGGHGLRQTQRLLQGCINHRHCWAMAYGFVYFSIQYGCEVVGHNHRIGK